MFPRPGLLGQRPASRTTYYVYKDKLLQWRWRLVVNGNNRRIADSGEGYFNKQDCYAAIALVKGSGSSPVKEI